MKKLASQIVNYVAASAELTSRLQTKLAAYEQEKKVAAEKTAAVLQALLDSGCVRGQNKQAAAGLLAKHATTLDLAATMAAKIAELTEAVSRRNSELGAPELDAKVASDVSTTAAYSSNYIGRKGDRTKKASDLAWLEITKPPKTV